MAKERGVRIFVLDGKPGRRWTEMAPGAIILRVIAGVIRGDKPAGGDVLLFHAETGSLLVAASAFANDGVVVISVNQGGGAGSEQPSGFYERRRGVGSPVDAHFTSCLSHFIKRLKETGRPDWTLLEGPPAPDALLAYHLLGLLPHDAGAVAARQGLVDAALEEGRVIAEANGRAAPTNAEIRDREYLRGLLQR